jgi:hypothetical protein
MTNSHFPIGGHRRHAAPSPRRENKSNNNPIGQACRQNHRGQTSVNTNTGSPASTIAVADFAASAPPSAMHGLSDGNQTASCGESPSAIATANASHLPASRIISFSFLSPRSHLHNASRFYPKYAP